MVAAASAWSLSGYLHDRGWTSVGSVDQVSRERVVYVRAHRLFLVSTPDGPLALSATSPHLDHRLLYCPSSGLFEGIHGERFDRLGSYFAGPSPRSMDRIELRVEGNEIWTDPKRVVRGATRAESTPLNADGPFCPDGVESPTEPGFAIDP